MDSVLSPVSPDMPLVTALQLAPPARLCGVWIEGAAHSRPFPVRIAAPAGWRSLLLGSDLGLLLTLVDSAIVDAGAGPVRLAADQLRARRSLELFDGSRTCIVPLAGSSPESVVANQPGSLLLSRMRYMS